MEDRRLPAFLVALIAVGVLFANAERRFELALERWADRQPMPSDHVVDLLGKIAPGAAEVGIADEQRRPAGEDIVLDRRHLRLIVIDVVRAKEILRRLIGLSQRARRAVYQPIRLKHMGEA